MPPKKELSKSQILLTDEEREELQNMSVEDLRKELARSNKERTINKSKEIDAIIQEKTKSGIDGVIKEAKQKLEEEITAKFEDYHVLVDQYQTEFEQRYLLLRQTINDSFLEMKERHISQFTEMKIEKEAEDLHAEKWESSQVRELRLLSTHLADTKDYEKAAKVDVEADELLFKESEETKRLNKLQYNKKKSQLFEQFAKELAMLEERLEKGNDALRSQLDHDILVAQKQLEVTVQSLLLDTINQSNKQVKRKDKQTEISTKLTQFVRTKAQKEGMNRKLLFDKE